MVNEGTKKLMENLNAMVDNGDITPDIFYYRAGALRLMGQAPKAYMDLSLALSLDPTKVLYLLERSLIYHEMGLHDRAVHDIDLCVEVSNDFLDQINEAREKIYNDPIEIPDELRVQIENYCDGIDSLAVEALYELVRGTDYSVE